MYNVSSDFIEAAKDIAFQTEIIGTIGKINFTHENILANSFTVINQCSNESTLDIGQVYIGELNATFVNINLKRNEWKNQNIKPSVIFKNSDMNVNIPLGIFTIQEATWTNNGIKIVAYDSMSKLDKKCNATINNKKTFQIASEICGACGISLGTTLDEFSTFANGNENLSLFKDAEDIETWRDLTAWLAQTTCTFATIGRDGKLYFKEYRNTSNFNDELSPFQRHTGGSFADYSTRYTGISIVDLFNKWTRYYSVETDDALTYNLGSNPLLQFENSNDRERCCRAILSKLQNINYTPFSINIAFGMHYDLGDILKFTDGLAGTISYGCITKLEYHFSSADKFSGSGEDPEIASGRSKSDKNISGLLSEVSSLNSYIGSSTERKYDYVNEDETITIADGGEIQKICEIEYKAGNGQRVEFNAEIKIDVETTETFENNIYTVNDLNVNVKYKDDELFITEYEPEEIFTDGTHLLELLYFWKSSTKEENDRIFTVWIECLGGNIVIQPKNVHAYIITSGSLNPDIYPVGIEIANYPSVIDVGGIPMVDMDSIKIIEIYSDGSEIDITDDCTFDTGLGDLGNLDLSTTDFGDLNIGSIDELNVDIGYLDPEFGEFEIELPLIDLLKGEIVSISIFTPPNKLRYHKGEPFDWTGLSIWASSSNGTTEDVTSQCTFSHNEGETSSNIGKIIVTATYTPEESEEQEEQEESEKTFTANFTINIVEITSIAVNTMPIKLEYIVGEKYDWSGLTLIATYNDNVTEIWDKYSDGSHVTELGEFTVVPAAGVTVVWGEPPTSDEPKPFTIAAGIVDPFNSDYFFTNFVIGIYTIKELQIEELPVLIDYDLSQPLDLSGIQINAIFDDDTIHDITDLCTFNPTDGTKLLTPGTNTVEYSFGEFSGSFDVEVGDEIAIEDVYTIGLRSSIDFNCAWNGTGYEDITGHIRENDRTLHIFKSHNDGNYTYSIIIHEPADITDDIEVFSEEGTFARIPLMHICGMDLQYEVYYPLYYVEDGIFHIASLHID